MVNRSIDSYSKQTCDSTKIQFKYFTFVLIFFTATWLTSNIAAIKLVSIHGITLTGGFIIFPFTTMSASIIVEVYGYKNARQATWAGLILHLIFIIFIFIICILPSSSHWKLSEQFNEIFLPDIRVILASTMIFFIADFVNSYLMATMKIKALSLIKRILIACSISFFIDVSLFLTFAFYDTISNEALVKLILFAYVKRLICQIILFPFICYIVYKLKKIEGIDIIDNDTKFNPFILDNVYEIHSHHKMGSKTDGTTHEIKVDNHVKI